MIRSCTVSTFLRTRRLPATAAMLLALASVATLRAQTGALFPQPFRVEHHLVQDDGDGSRFVGDSVVDTYGGSWIVSQRPDGARLIVDLARRELTEVQPEKGIYWTLSFDRLAELQARLRQAQGLARPAASGDDEARSGSQRSTVAAANHGGAAASGAPDAGLVVTEVAPDRAGAASSMSSSSAAPSERAGVKHLRVAARQQGGVAADVWVDPSVRLTPGAQAAIGALEMALAVPPQQSRASSGDKSGATAEPALPSPATVLAAVRAQSGGALPVRTVRTLLRDEDGNATASVEDVATRVETLERFPTELAEVPEGARRVPHPLETTVRFLEEEAVRNAAMSGTGEDRP
jgi:hypothetical protein